VDVSTPYFICVRTMSDDVPLPPLGSIGPLRVGGGRVKNSKNGEWSHSCFWGLASPGGGKRGNEIFVTMGVNGEFLQFGGF